MNNIKSPLTETRLPDPKTSPSPPGRKVRTVLLIMGLTFLFIGFAPFLLKLARFAYLSDLHSYLLIIPAIVIYLLFLNRKKASSELVPHWPLATVLLCIALAALILTHPAILATDDLPESDRLGLSAFSLVTFVLGWVVLTMGILNLRAFAFPLLFLYFVIPLPTWGENAMSHFLQWTSAEVFYLIFSLTGVPIWRDGYVFQLPGLCLEVAEECSGIRSTLVLIMTGLLAAHLFLRTLWRRAMLVLCTLAIGILRNSVRIAVLALLTVKVNPKVISSPLHHQGGPLFFILSLVPLFLVLYLLRKGETSTKRLLTGKS